MIKTTKLLRLRVSISPEQNPIRLCHELDLSVFRPKIPFLVSWELHKQCSIVENLSFLRVQRFQRTPLHLVNRKYFPLSRKVRRERIRIHQSAYRQLVRYFLDALPHSIPAFHHASNPISAAHKYHSTVAREIMSSLSNNHTILSDSISNFFSFVHVMT